MKIIYNIQITKNYNGKRIMKKQLSFSMAIFLTIFIFVNLSGNQNYPQNQFSRDENINIRWYRGMNPSQEIREKRTFNSKIFRLENGTIVYRIFSRPVHYISEHATLEDLQDSCSCYNWEIYESYGGYADGLFGDKLVCGQGASYIQINETYYYRGFVEFNTGIIPDTTSIDSVELNLNCVQWPISETHDIWSMESKPSVSGGMVVFNDAVDGNCYVNDYDGGTGWNLWELDSVACQDIEDLLPEDWFAIGISDYYSSSASYTLLYQCGTGWLDVKEPAAIEETTQKKPARVTMLQNHPNPFSTSTTITISSAQEHKCTSAQDIDLSIYDVSGKLVRSFSLFSPHPSLITSVSWDGTDESGKLMPSGTYFYKLIIGNESITKRMLLIR
jgi:hypothetical protein